MPTPSTKLQPENPPHASENPFPNLHSPLTEAKAVLRLVGRNGRTSTVQALRDLITVSPRAEEILQFYAHRNPPESEHILEMLEWRRQVLNEFDRMTGHQGSAASPATPRQGSRSCAACEHCNRVEIIHPGRSEFDHRAKCEKGRWRVGSVKAAVLEKKTARFRRLALRCPDFILTG